MISHIRQLIDDRRYDDAAYTYITQVSGEAVSATAILRFINAQHSRGRETKTNELRKAFERFRRNGIVRIVGNGLYTYKNTEGVK
jgi:hypothetical protein